MKIKKIKIILLLFSICIFFLLVIFNIKFMKKEKEQEKTISLSNKKKSEVILRKNYDYSDILEVLGKCSSKFVVNKINKTESSNNKISVEIKYEGGSKDLVNGVYQLRNQEIVDSINDINILKKDEDKCTAELQINFYKVK